MTHNGSDRIQKWLLGICSSLLILGVLGYFRLDDRLRAIETRVAVIESRLPLQGGK